MRWAPSWAAHRQLPSCFGPGHLSSIVVKSPVILILGQLVDFVRFNDVLNGKTQEIRFPGPFSHMEQLLFPFAEVAIS
jgi:hypothetical protein